MKRPDYLKNCTIECERMVTCAVCGLLKTPEGRSAPWELGRCGAGCAGYFAEPRAGHLWRGELARIDTDDV